MKQIKGISLIFAAIALTSLVGCAATSTHQSTGQYVNDSAITGKVKTAIFNTPGLKSTEINVETYNGQVQLTGFINSRADMNQAVAVAQGVSGVTSVKNDMRIK